MSCRKKMVWLLALVVVVFVSAPPSIAAEFKVPPVDEAVKDASLVAFRDKLLDAIARRDIDYVVKQAAPDIKLSFGGNHGQEHGRDVATAWVHHPRPGLPAGRTPDSEV